MMSLNMKLQSSVAKNQARNIDMELRKIEAREAKELLSIIQVRLLLVHDIFLVLLNYLPSLTCLKFILSPIPMPRTAICSSRDLLEKLISLATRLLKHMVYPNHLMDL